MADLYTAWNRLRIKLRRSGDLREFVAVVETSAAGRLHLHVLMTGQYIPQHVLSRLAAEARFGAICDIREVKRAANDPRECAEYVAKELAGYVTKAKVESLTGKTARRRRPVRQSRQWCGDSAREAERIVVQQSREQEKDEGPWAFIQKAGDGSLHVRLPDQSHVVVPAQPAPNDQLAPPWLEARPTAEPLDNEPSPKRPSGSAGTKRGRTARRAPAGRARTADHRDVMTAPLTGRELA